MPLLAVEFLRALRFIGSSGSAMGKKKFYAVAVGKSPGIYTTWDECKAQVNGYPNAKFKGFESQHEADSFLANFLSATLSNKTEHVAVKRRHQEVATPSDECEAATPKRSRPSREIVEDFVDIFTDGACSHQGTALARAGVGASFPTKYSHLNVSEPLDIKLPTNNQAELTAILRAMEQARDAGIKRIRINTDSVYAFNGFTTQWLEANNGNIPNGDIINRIVKMKPGYYGTKCPHIVMFPKMRKQIDWPEKGPRKL